MAATPVSDAALLPQAEISRLARVLARYLAGRQVSAGGAQVAGRKVGQGLDFLDFRDYQPGDDLRSVDWRASARSGRIQVRRYCGDVSSDWYLCLDASASMGFASGEKWLQARRLAAAFAYVLLYLGHRVSLVLFSSGVDALCPLGRGHAQYARLLSTLNRHTLPAAGGDSNPACCTSVVAARAPLLLISDFLRRDAMLPALDELRSQRRELQLLQIAGSHDLLAPEGDDILLQDIESGDTVYCVAAEAARPGARRRFAELQGELQEWSARYRIPCTACSEVEAWRDVLLRHFITG